MDRNDKMLVGEHPFGDAGQLIILCIFIIVWALDSFILKWTIFLGDNIPLFIRIPGGLLAVLVAAYLTVVTVRTMFFRPGEKPMVVDFGVYRSVRHPMYLGTILFYLGLVLMTMSIAAAVVLTATIGFYQYIARYEEKLLLRALGDDYRAYMKRTGMWIPKIL